MQNHIIQYHSLFATFLEKLKIITMVVGEEGEGSVHIHDKTVLLLYYNQKHFCQHIATCIISAIKWVNGTS